MSKLTTLEQMQEAYVQFSKELFEEGCTASPILFVQVMSEWVLADGSYRLDDLALARKFLCVAGYPNEDIDTYLSDIWGAEYKYNVEASIAQAEVDHTISLYYDGVITLEVALESLRVELEQAKRARDEFFERYPEGKIM